MATTRITPKKKRNPKPSVRVTKRDPVNDPPAVMVKGEIDGDDLKPEPLFLDLGGNTYELKSDFNAWRVYGRCLATYEQENIDALGELDHWAAWAYAYITTDREQQMREAPNRDAREKHRFSFHQMLEMMPGDISSITATMAPVMELWTRTNAVNPENHVPGNSEGGDDKETPNTTAS